MRVLGRIPESQFTRRAIVLGHGGPCFHRVRNETLLEDSVFDDDAIRFCLSKRRVNISATHGPVKCLVAVNIVMQLRGATL